jgi:cell division protein FtsL
MNNKSKYNVLTYLFLLLTVFILFLFTKNIYYTVKENSNIVSSLEEKITQKQEEYDKLSKIKLAIES